MIKMIEIWNSFPASFLGAKRKLNEFSFMVVLGAFFSTTSQGLAGE